MTQFGVLSKLHTNLARGGVYFSCATHGKNLFSRKGCEMETICRALNNNPIMGFFNQGNISNNRLYGYTGVLTLLL